MRKHLGDRRTDMLLLLVWLVTIVAVVGYTRQQVQAVDERHLIRVCKSAEQNRTMIRIVLERSRSLALEHSEDPKATNAYYDEILNAIPQLECLSLLKGAK